VSRAQKPKIGLLFFLEWHRDAGDFHIDGAQMVAARKIEGLPVITAKGEVGGRRCPVNDATELFAV
jgi:hypothetical protein